MSKSRLSSLLILVVAVAAVVNTAAQDHVTKSLELTDQTSGNSVVITTSTTTADQNIALPATLPSSTGHVLSVQSASGSNVTATWSPLAPSGAVNGLFLVKTADQSTNSTTASNITDLSWSLTANRVYYIEAMIRVSETVGTDTVAAELVFSVPSGTIVHYYMNCANQFTIPASTSTGYISRDNTADSFGDYSVVNAAPMIVNNSTIRVYSIKGMVLCGNSDGTCQLQFRRQNGTTSNEVTIHQYSFVKINSL